MNPTLQKLLMLRNADLVRWGRLSALIWFLMGALALGGAIAVQYFTANKLAPLLARNAELDAAYLTKLGTRAAASYTGVHDGNLLIHQGILEICKALSIILLGTSIMAFFTSATCWRAYELAAMLIQAAPDTSIGMNTSNQTPDNILASPHPAPDHRTP